MNSRNIPKFITPALVLLLSTAAPLAAQSIKFARVVSKRVARTTELPGELYPFETVQLQAKIQSYVEAVLVDRGSSVKRGDLLVRLSAPEMMARISQAQAQLTSAESDETQAEAQLAAARSTYSRIEEASKTPGAVAENDLVQAKQQTEAAQASVQSRKRMVDSFKSNLKSQQDLAAYLRVTAPFDGLISTRYVHPGALVGPGVDMPLLQLDQISHLRLAVAVPESDIAGLVKGTKVDFKVSAYPDRTFSGIIARPAYALDMKTRTMPVELDVANPHHLLAPGMYPAVLWPVERLERSLLVPSTSIVTTTERVFVIRNKDGHAEWVNVRRGPRSGDLVEVTGDLKPGDQVVERGTDEIRNGSELKSNAK